MIDQIQKTTATWEKLSPQKVFFWELFPNVAPLPPPLDSKSYQKKHYFWRAFLILLSFCNFQVIQFSCHSASLGLYLWLWQMETFEPAWQMDRKIQNTWHYEKYNTQYQPNVNVPDKKYITQYQLNIDVPDKKYIRKNRKS